MTLILGISAFFHDSSAALIKNGNILGAVQEERFTRIKHDLSFPLNSIKFLLTNNGLNLNDIDFVCFHDKPLLKFNRLIKTYFAEAPFGWGSFSQAMPNWLGEKLYHRKMITRYLSQISDKFDKKKLFSLNTI